MKKLPGAGGFVRKTIGLNTCPGCIDFSRLPTTRKKQERKSKKGIKVHITFKRKRIRDGSGGEGRKMGRKASI